ncbi:helix-turn-helix domain-containing protein [Niallia sp. Krafla_26]|uniref:helix-turn-helix domain-containing protein n=1 Tax=Niallia sp. Krafla_26 TaxID=3064703 RepID=UPI003D177288
MEIGYGEFIKRHRKASGYKTMRQLAEKSGISVSTISRIEKEIQKPEARTLKALAEYLETTTYVELMVVCGYWEEDELLDVVNEDPKEYKYEKEFVQKIDLSDEELMEQFDLKLDGKSLTEEEAKGLIAYIRTLRQVEK